MSEEQKAERRTLIANNKAWDSAETVRRAWLAESFLTRTSPPKGAETFLALAVAHGEHPDDAYRLHADLSAKGAETPGDDWQRRYNAKSNITARADAAAPRQVLMLALALLVCEWESTTSRNTWRRPSDRDRRYLTALIGWGYQPSDVERLILAQPEPTDPSRPTTPPSRPSRPGRRHRRAGRGRRHRRAGRGRRRPAEPVARPTTPPSRPVRRADVHTTLRLEVVRARRTREFLEQVAAALSDDERVEGVTVEDGAAARQPAVAACPHRDRSRRGVERCRGRPARAVHGGVRVRRRAAPAGLLRG